jgi:putative FmdB family regulatory protein
MLCSMPIYEYRCEPCEGQFEELVRGPEAAVACPTCGSAQVERLLSVFAGVGGRQSALPEHPRLNRPAGGGCCGGACGHMH